MLRFFLLLLTFLAAHPAAAQLRPSGNTAITPQLVVDGPVRPGSEVDLAIVMTPEAGWHGYWENPGDAGQSMSVEWQLPQGTSVGPLRYPVPERLTIAGLMNYVYKGPYAVLTRLKVPANASGILPVRAEAQWLACTDKICVPEQGSLSLDIPIGGGPDESARFDEWRQKLPRPLGSPTRFALSRDKLRLAIPLPRSVTIGEPYVFPAEDGTVDYAGEQQFRRSGDTLVAELPRRSGEPRRFSGVLSLGDGRGLSFEAVPGPVPEGGRPLGGDGADAILLAVLGALVGGLLLNLMPCVFPILALKALALAKAGSGEREARRDALAYTAGAVIGTGALGLILLAIRAGGSAAGWAFQLQDPRTILILLLLSVAITLNLLGLFRLPVIGGETSPRSGFATGALAAFVATPCAGPFLGAALGTALLLPAAGAVLVFAALGLGLAIPFLLVAFVPALRRRLPRPGPWMQRLQRFLAIPMAATAAGCLWLLWRQGGWSPLLAGTVAVVLLGFALALAGRRQRSGQPALGPAVVLALVAASLPILGLGRGEMAVASRVPTGTAQWSEERVAAALKEGRPAFVYFTADWCLTCKVNEAGAINRDSVREAFKANRVELLAGDWTNGDPAITRFLESRGRAGVPLYLWYEPGQAEPEELPQVLTPGMLTERAQRRG
ncbi:protein-disulfide reductase DsbD family protein [Sphingomonas arenae]|uniref:protein-disulfide reductase DsbD family protein n=1 Tax=Sphingomonas arenae TaxID=2812555 RepID=UPI0019674BE6|nr:thioredoxin family protein [Sphingomonas arenae]